MDFKYLCDTCVGGRCDYCDAKRLWSPNRIYYYIKELEGDIEQLKSQCEHCSERKED